MKVEEAFDTSFFLYHLKDINDLFSYKLTTLQNNIGDNKMGFISHI